MTTRVALAAGLMVLMALLTHAQQVGCKVTLSQYNHLRVGMSYQRAIAILGCEGKNPVFSQLEPHTYAQYSWDGTSPEASMTVRFRSGELIEKFQSGLR